MPSLIVSSPPHDGSFHDGTTTTATATSSTPGSDYHHPDHHRIVLLFDLDCFYAQCERVRLGLEVDVSLALLQWNSVLAVTYPARTFGIQRGDSWEAVEKKSDGKCWAIHLKLLDLKKKTQQSQQEQQSSISQPSQSQLPGACTVGDTDNVKNQQSQQYKNENVEDDNEQINEGDSTIEEDIFDDNDENIERAFNAIYKQPLEKQLECRQKERGLRRYSAEGKACLERYRIASMRIFNVVLESLTKRLGQNRFVLERASIDEFYLDITPYCYGPDEIKDDKKNEIVQMRQQGQTNTQQQASFEGNLQDNDNEHKTVVVGSQPPFGSDDVQYALEKACIVSHWIRTDVWKTLGFTMSAGISTNKMMAKLAASYGKPNGQAVLHPKSFQHVLNDTKIRKVRYFGGKLGKQVLKLLQANASGNVESDDARMGDLRQFSLPFLLQHLSKETAQFVFDACRGLDTEPVKETAGALVKSITAFKSFAPTDSIQEIQSWLSLLAGEVVARVNKDTARNGRYPKSCTLTYCYFATPSGMRPNGVKSASSVRQSKSFRINFPHDKHPDKAGNLIQQAMERLTVILKERPLQRMGLSASNFESRGGQPGIAAIDTFFKQAKPTSDYNNGKPVSSSQQMILTAAPTNGRKQTTKTLGKRGATSLDTFFFLRPKQENADTNEPTTTDSAIESSLGTTAAETRESHVEEFSKTVERQGKEGSERLPESTSSVEDDFEMAKRLQALESHNGGANNGPRLSADKPAQPTTKSKGSEDRDLEMAKRLQASFDRENYVLSKLQDRPKGNKKKVRRIDSFFEKR